MESLVSDIWAGDGKIINLFFTVYELQRPPLYTGIYTVGWLLYSILLLDVHWHKRCAVDIQICVGILEQSIWGLGTE
jgi:hypothetical protein